VSERHVPLIVIGSASSALADSVAVTLRREGSVVYVTHSPEGCLRVASSIAPDAVLLDQRFPSRIENLLKAHPMSARAQIFHLSDDLSRVVAHLPRTPLSADPHAA